MTEEQKKMFMSFRPQQGLLIMNSHVVLTKEDWQNCFRPQQGLLIMNRKFGYTYERLTEKASFRPQQGLLIMN